MFPRYSYALLLVGLLVWASPQAGTLGEDEIQLVTRPYTLASQRTFRVRTNLVLVPVVVRDARGKPIGGLKQSDFQIFDNGKQQAISAFSVENSPRVASNAPKPTAAPRSESSPAGPPAVSSKPRFVALFFDDVNSRLQDLVAARTAAENFIRGELRVADRVGIFTTSATITLDFTDDMRRLLDSLAKIQVHARSADEGPAACPPMTPWQAHMIIDQHDRQALELGIAEGLTMGCLPTALGKSGAGQREMAAGIVRNRAEAVLSTTEQFSEGTLERLASVIVSLAGKSGDRLLLLSSAGFFTQTQVVGSRLSKLIDVALRASVVINSLDAKGLAVDPPRGRMIFDVDNPSLPRPDLMTYADTLQTQQRDANNDPLSLLAEGTGGRFFHNNNDLARGMRELAAVPEVSYLLGFAPVTAKPDGRFHELKVKLATPRGESLQARRGYFAPTATDLARDLVLATFDSQVLGTVVVANFVARVTAVPGKLESGELGLNLALYLDVRGLYFEHRRDRSVAKLRCVFALFDAQGNFLKGLEAVVDFALKEQSLARLAPTGLYEHLTLEAPPGSYRLRAVLQEQAQGQMVTLNQPVVVP